MNLFSVVTDTKKLGFVCLVVVVGFAASCSSGNPKSDESIRNTDGAIVTGGKVGVFALVEGDCFTDSEVKDNAVAVNGVPCTESHRYEVYHSFTPEGDVYPADIDEVWKEGCKQQFEEFVGIPFVDSELLYSALYPGKKNWEDPESRTVRCLISAVDESDRTESAAGSEV